MESLEHLSSFERSLYMLQKQAESNPGLEPWLKAALNTMDTATLVYRWLTDHDMDPNTNLLGLTTLILQQEEKFRRKKSSN
jgi:hypothetical protein